MPTKIINVLKDDRFDDILDIFKKTSAEEVIFVLPKKHKAFAQEADFEVLSAVAEEHGKNVLMLTSNPEVNNLALQYSFGVLTSEKPEKPVKRLKVERRPSESEISQEKDSADKVEPELELEPEPEPEPTAEKEAEVEVNSDDGWGQEDTENTNQGAPTYSRQEDGFGPEVELAAAKKPSKMLSDIIEPERGGEKIRVETPQELKQPTEVNVNKRNSIKTDMDEIKSVWERPASQARQKPETDNIRPIFRQKEKTTNPRPLSFPNFHFDISKKALSLFGISVIAMFLTVLYLTMGNAQIIIKPRPYPLDFSLKVSASDKFEKVDPELKRIPGQLFSTQKKIEETFQATGERDVVQKARGRVVVYNEYGTTPQVLIATTRFESEGGLIFRTLQTITVPGTKVQNGKIIPGTIEVEVIADKAGDTYNIEPSRFSIPAFKEKGDNDRYQKFYAMSQEKMKGGIVGKSKVVTEQDYVNAKKKVEERVIAEIKKEFENQSAGLKVLNMSEPSVKEIVSTAQIDEAIDKFTLTAEAGLETVGFREEDLNQLIADHVSGVNNLMILPEKLKIVFDKVEFDPTDKTLNFEILITGPAYSNINKEKIMTDLIGKNENQIKDYIKSMTDIVSARVILSPFWVRKVPANQTKIKFEVQYE